MDTDPVAGNVQPPVINSAQSGTRIPREQIPEAPADLSQCSVGRFWYTKKPNSRQLARLHLLRAFFTEERLRTTVVPILSVTSNISLRALDWFVINYAKKHQIALGPLGCPSSVVNVYSSYRSALKFFHRNLFDTFRRGSRIYFPLAGQVYSTTVAQLNYLHWAEISGVLCYAQNNIQVIEQDMNARIAECRKEKERIVQAGGKRKRSELCQTVPKKVAIYRVPSTVVF